MTWRVLFVRSRMELQTSDLLRKRFSVEGFSPFVRETRRQRGPHGRVKVVTIEKAYFPGYVFFRDIDRFLPYIQELHGVLAVVNVQGKPLEVPVNVMDTLFSISDSKGCVSTQDFTRPWTKMGLKLGGLVRFKSDTHILNGFIGRLSSLARLEKDGEISAFVQMLGSEREVRVPIDIVDEVVDDGKARDQQIQVP